MNIRSFIDQQVLLPRLRRSGVLVIYDPEARYSELCLELRSERLLVIEASESSIESRVPALAAPQAWASPTLLGKTLVYVRECGLLFRHAKRVKGASLEVSHVY